MTDEQLDYADGLPACRYIFTFQRESVNRLTNSAPDSLGLMKAKERLDVKA